MAEAETLTTPEEEIKAGKAAMDISFGEAVGGISAIALAIIGMSGVFPGMLASVATIAVGVAFLFQGGSLAQRFKALRSQADVSARLPRYGGMSAVFLAGVTGIALGILSLSGVAGNALIAVAAIVYGAALIIDSGAEVRLSRMEEEQGLVDASRTPIVAASGIQVLVGLASVALGGIGLSGINLLILSLSAMLIIGAAGLISSSIISERVLDVFSQ